MPLLSIHLVPSSCYLIGTMTVNVSAYWTFECFCGAHSSNEALNSTARPFDAIKAEATAHFAQHKENHDVPITS